jgi:hypothetical protein
MTKYAWVENDLIRDIAPGNPSEFYTPDIAAFYNVEVTDEVERGWSLLEGVWTAPPEPEPASEPTPPPAPVMRTKLSRPEFKLQFTATERIGIRMARDYDGADPAQTQLKLILNDFFDIIEDPALTHIDMELAATIEGVGFLATAGLIAPERVDVILAGVEG